MVLKHHRELLEKHGILLVDDAAPGKQLQATRFWWLSAYWGSGFWSTVLWRLLGDYARSVSHNRKMLVSLDKAAERHPLVAEVRLYAREGQRSIDQRRSSTGEPYGVHTEGAADLIAFLVDSPDLIAAALLHDHLEDIPGQTRDGLAARFTRRIADLVSEVTNEFTASRYPGLPRTARKQREGARLATISADGKLMKLADIADNTRSAGNLSADFSKVYLAEVGAYLAVLEVPGSDHHRFLADMSRDHIARAQSGFRPLPRTNGPLVSRALGR